MIKCQLVLLQLASLLWVAAPAISRADDPAEFSLTIQNHAFAPATLEVPANQQIKLTVLNKDVTAEEFESHDLAREKIVTGMASVVVYVGPLKPGRYIFFGDFHRATAQGVLVVH